MSPVIVLSQFAEVVRRMRDLDIEDQDPQLFNKFQTAFASVLGGESVERTAHININLPDLEEQVQADIVQDNVLATSALYFAAQLEDLKFFQVMDRVCDQFSTGMIPLVRSVPGQEIFKYIREATDRFTENERRSIYARAFGFAQGSVDEPMPNRAFSDLWIRFLSAVSTKNREFGAQIKMSTTDQAVAKNGRDLAVNLSLHGYGIAHFAATDLQKQIKEVLRILSYNDVLQAYGVLDVWQLVERVSAMWLGGSVNGVRQRTLATTGSKIIQWLASHQTTLMSEFATLDVERERLADGLITQVERWLAVTGTDDQSVERYSEPVSISAQPTIPDMSLRAVPDMMSGLMPTNGASNALLQAQNALGSLAKA